MSDLLVQMNDVLNAELVDYYQATTPKYYLVLGSSSAFPVDQKPNWVRRTFIRLLFGWKFVDAENFEHPQETKQMLYG